MSLVYILSGQMMQREMCPMQMMNEPEYNTLEIVPRPLLESPFRRKGSRQFAHGSPPTYIRLLLSVECEKPSVLDLPRDSTDLSRS